MTQGARELTPTEIEDLAAGAWILGAGGAGNPYHSLLTLRAEAARGFRPAVIPASALADDDLVAVVSTMGAPLVGEERLPDPDVAARPVQVLAERLGRPFVAVWCGLRSVARSGCRTPWWRRGQIFQCWMPTAWDARSPRRILANSMIADSRD